MSGKLVMGFWDCAYCGTKKIKGTYEDCPYCSAPRNKDTKFYMEEVVYLTDEEAELKGKGADWHCAYCDSLVSVLSETCDNCGASREASSRDYFQIQEEKRLAALESFPSAEPEKKPKKGMNLKLILGLILGLAVLAAGIIWALTPDAETLKITEMSWENRLEIEASKIVRESDWSLPSGGSLVYTQKELHHYDSILSHYETKTRTYTEQVVAYYETEYDYIDNGDGTFTEISRQVPVYETVTRTETYEDPVYISVPVYKTKYYYDIERWEYERAVVTEGADKTPYWGEVILEEDEREGNRNCEYFISGYEIDDTEKEVEIYPAPEYIWQECNVGEERTFIFEDDKIIEFAEE